MTINSIVIGLHIYCKYAKINCNIICVFKSVILLYNIAISQSFNGALQFMQQHILIVPVLTVSVSV